MPPVRAQLIATNFAVWLFYELPNLNAAVNHASFYPCGVDNSRRPFRAPEPWGISWITAMFLHGSWDHVLDNMLFLAIFGKNVEDAYGPLRFLLFYFAGGFAAMIAQTGISLWFGTPADGWTANLGASGAVAAVLGAYFVLYPGSKVTTWIFPIFVFRIPAWIYLGLWFLYQLIELIEADFGLFKASANGGGFIFGLLVTLAFTRVNESRPRKGGKIEASGSLGRGEFDEHLLGGPRGLASGRVPAEVLAPGPHVPCRAIVLLVRAQNAVQLGLDDRIADRGDNLHPPGEVACHPVGRADEKLGRAAVLEAVDPAVLEESAEDAEDLDRR